MEFTQNNWFFRKLETFQKNLETKILSDKSLKCRVVYGPLLSRRLGTVIGINNVKQKACTYNCVYCPVGKTSFCSICNNSCLSPYDLHLSLKNKIGEIDNVKSKIKFLVFSGSGEPTLDSNLMKEILLLREFGYKIAVYTNSSLLWNDRIKENLFSADYVSVKIDTVNEETWIKLNRPHKRLSYDNILDGIDDFSKSFRGVLTTETILVKKHNDSLEEMSLLSKFLNSLQRGHSYFSIPMYPSVQPNIIGPDIETEQELIESIKNKIRDSVIYCCPENDSFYTTNDFENELMGLLMLHPIREDAIHSFVSGKGDSEIYNKLLIDNKIKKLKFNGRTYLTGFQNDSDFIN